MSQPDNLPPSRLPNAPPPSTPPPSTLPSGSPPSSPPPAATPQFITIGRPFNGVAPPAPPQYVASIGRPFNGVAPNAAQPVQKSAGFTPFGGLISDLTTVGKAAQSGYQYIGNGLAYAATKESALGSQDIASKNFGTEFLGGVVELGGGITGAAASTLGYAPKGTLMGFQNPSKGVGADIFDIGAGLGYGAQFLAGGEALGALKVATIGAKAGLATRTAFNFAVGYGVGSAQGALQGKSNTQAIEQGLFTGGLFGAGEIASAGISKAAPFISKTISPVTQRIGDLRIPTFSGEGSTLADIKAQFKVSTGSAFVKSTGNASEYVEPYGSAAPNPKAVPVEKLISKPSIDLLNEIEGMPGGKSYGTGASFPKGNYSPSIGKTYSSFDDFTKSTPSGNGIDNSGRINPTGKSSGSSYNAGPDSQSLIIKTEPTMKGYDSGVYNSSLKSIGLDDFSGGRPAHAFGFTPFGGSLIGGKQTSLGQGGATIGGKTTGLQFQNSFPTQGHQRNPFTITTTSPFTIPTSAPPGITPVTTPGTTPGTTPFTIPTTTPITTPFLIPTTTPQTTPKTTPQTTPIFNPNFDQLAEPQYFTPFALAGPSFKTPKAKTKGKFKEGTKKHRLSQNILAEAPLLSIEDEWKL